MPLWLTRNRLVDRRIQEFVALGRTQGLTQIRSVILTEAHEERAGAGDTNAVTRFTEIVRQRCDKTETSAGFLYMHVARGTSRAIVDVLERKPLCQSCSYDRQRQILIETRFINVAERHDLDYGQIHASSVSPLDQADDLIFVHALQRDRIDLDIKTLRLCRIDASHDIFKVAPTRDGSKFVRLECVELDIDPSDAVRLQFGRVFTQL